MGRNEMFMSEFHGFYQGAGRQRGGLMGGWKVLELTEGEGGRPAGRGSPAAAALAAGGQAPGRGWQGPHQTAAAAERLLHLGTAAGFLPADCSPVHRFFSYQYHEG